MIYDTVTRTFFPGSVTFDRLIRRVSRGDAVPKGDVIDARGGYVIPGLVDVHTHGRGNIDVMTATADELVSMGGLYRAAGVTTLFPTVMTAPQEEMIAAIHRIRSAAASPYKQVHMDGIHIEGPYISEKKAGCHPIFHIREMAEGEAMALAFACRPLRCHITLAPEKPGADAFIREAIISGATVGIGHTAASYGMCLSALKAGADAFTHLYNAMSPLHHRAAGAVGAALDTEAFSEIICDGEHTLDWIFHAKGDVRFSAEAAEDAVLGDSFGYEHFTEVKKLNCEASLTAEYRLPGRTLQAELDCADMDVYTAKSPANPATEYRTAVILRMKGTKAVFSAKYTEKMQ